MATLNLHIDNMHCAACIRRVMTALNALPGTHADEVAIGSARISTNSPAAEIQQALIAAGYPATISQ